MKLILVLFLSSFQIPSANSGRLVSTNVKAGCFHFFKSPEHPIENFLTRKAREAISNLPESDLRHQFLEFKRNSFLNVPELNLIKKEVLLFRKLSFQEKEGALEELAGRVSGKIRAKKGVDSLAYHFNLNGGVDYDTIERGGIQATRSDISLQYTGVPAQDSFAPKVFFFRASEKSLVQVLSERNPKHMFVRRRMGSVLIVFQPNHPALVKMLKDKKILREEQYFFEYDEGKISNENRIGIPSEAFLVLPLSIELEKQDEKVLGNLTFDEETFVILKKIERMIDFTP